MKKFLVCILIVGLLCSVPSGIGFAKANDLTLKFAIPTTLDDFAGKGVLLMKDVVEQESQGKIKMNIFPAAQLGSMREHWEGCQVGAIDMVTVISSSLEPFVPEVAILGMPFLFPNDYENGFEKMWGVMDNVVKPLLNSRMEEKGFVLLGITSYGYAQMTTSIKPIQKISDLKGIKMRVVPSPLLIFQYESWGANPTPVDFAELYISLQQGIVEAQENGLSIIDTKKLYEVQKYLSVTDHYPSMGLIAASKIFWDRISEDQKTVILSGVNESLKLQRALMLQERERLLKFLEEKGLEVNFLGDEAREEWSEASIVVHKKYASLSESNKKILDAVYEAVGK